ncbi:hypothetical protein QBC32DRAFT_310744 [Pseudoneurospora amorphoporcata]|uniref:F-box domain-containing protein n=1 Tax=Pseudoneurospora amorphoporcata TaxID=241081 RepID=A0AAN6P1J5_9PEZI|nr:hypothetical protein QBC32DRAFT_310744 [Pseudoneurospora amorphoporcata]
MAPHTGQDIPAPAFAAVDHNNPLFGMDQPKVDHPLPTVYDNIGQVVFKAGCPCLVCEQWIAQKRQHLNDQARILDGYDALIKPPAGPPASQSAPRDFITKLPKEILNMIVSYVMDGIHDWHYSPPKAPLHTLVQGQQQGQPYGHAEPEGRRDAGFLTDEKLLGLSQTCKLFRDLCNDFGAHAYLQIWAEFDEFLRDDFTRLSEADRGSGVISRVKHLIIRPPPNGRAYVSRPNRWDLGEAFRLVCIRTVLEGMTNLVSFEMHSSKKYDTLRNALKNYTLPAVRSLTLDSLAPLMGTLIRSFPNLRVLRSRSTAVWDRPDNEVFKSLQSSQLVETACFLGTRDNPIYRQHRTPQYALVHLPQLKHLFWEFNEPHDQADDIHMIEALRAHNNIRKFTMLRHAGRPPPDYSLAWDNVTTVAKTYFSRVPHLQEIGICRAQDRRGYLHADSGKVFLRIKKQVKAVKLVVGKEGGSGSNKNKDEEEKKKTTKTDKLSKTNKGGKSPETTTREGRRLLRVYNHTQSDEYRIKQLELGRISATPDRNPKPAGTARDPEYSMFELEWKWAKHQTLKEMYEREAAEAAETVSPDVPAADGVPADEPALAGIPAAAPATDDGLSSSSSSVVGDDPDIAAPHSVLASPSVFGGVTAAAAAADVFLAVEDAAQSIADGSSSESSTST